jgi:hypothetical protein
VCIDKHITWEQQITHMKDKIAKDAGGRALYRFFVLFTLFL